MKSHLFSALLLFSIKSANAAPWSNGGSTGNVATDSPCPVIQGAQLLGCLLKSDCLGGGPDRAYAQSDTCGGLKCCYDSIPCTTSKTGNICINNSETSCIGGVWENNNCPVGANGNLQCCKIPRLTSFHSTNEQASLEYFKSTSIPDLSLPLQQGLNLEQQPSEEGFSANALNGLDQYFENAQVPGGDYGLNLHIPAQAVTGNNLISYNGPPSWRA